MIVRPSNSHQWSICGASHKLQTNNPVIGAGETVNTGAEEGTAGHEVCEMLLKTYVNGTPLLYKKDVVGKLAENGVMFTEEMFEGAEDYVIEIIKLIKGDLSMRRDIHIEEKVKLDHIFPDMSGTPDCWIYDSQSKTFHIFDYKFGFGIVDVFENPQLMIYLSGIIQMFPFDESYKAVLHIIQPRAYHEEGSHRTWEFLASDIRGHINKLHFAAHVAMGDDGKESPGKHCRYCSARHICKALKSTVYNVIDVIAGNEPEILKGSDLANELTLLEYASDLLEYRLTAIKEQVTFELRSGKQLNGWSIEQKIGRKRWLPEMGTEEIVEMGEMMEIALKKPTALITPTQAIKKFKQLDVDVDIIEEYSEKPITGFKLVKDDINKIKQIFGRK